MKKITVKNLILGILYGWGVFFLIGLVIRLSVNYFYLGRVTLDERDVVNTIVLSSIAGISGGCGSWIFYKIDEYKSKKNPPSG